MTFPRVPMKAWVALYALALFLAASSFFVQTRVEAATTVPTFVTPNGVTTAVANLITLVIDVPTGISDADVLIAHIAHAEGSTNSISTPTSSIASSRIRGLNIGSVNVMNRAPRRITTVLPSESV